tara:strand:- start:589 stop:2106 length:1518 start_codon:yes stop_codon:yes gene_type:complete
MYRIISASKDAYITNKIINSKFRATDANTGQAGSLDLFKLYAETVSGSDTTPIELSRLLVKFDLTDVTSMHNNNIIDVGSSTFKAELNLHDIYGGETTPNNFHMIAFPLALSFDEGSGSDVINYADLDSANWVTASFNGSTVSPWNLPGAMKSGSLGTANIDVITSGTITGQATPINLAPVQYFETGEEDLKVDITNFVSASVKGLIANNGFLVGFSGSYETDAYSYFVKRFASRNTTNTAIRPKLILKFNDSLQDNHQNFEFDTTGSIYLNNFNRGTLANILSGAAAASITGADCMILKIQTGSFSKQFNVSQALRGEGRLTGIYSSSFAISSFDTNLYDHVLTSGSVTFDEIWSNSTETVTYLSSSLKVSKNNISSVNFRENRYLVSMTNLKHRYRQDEYSRLRVFAENTDRTIVFAKTPIEKPSEIFPNMFYRVRDTGSGNIIVPFDTSSNSTKLSSDNIGMYFDFYMSSLPRGRAYVFDYLIKQNGFDVVIKDAASKFIIE